MASPRSGGSPDHGSDAVEPRARPAGFRLRAGGRDDVPRPPVVPASNSQTVTCSAAAMRTSVPNVALTRPCSSRWYRR